MLFPGPPFWLHIVWFLCFLADFEKLAPVSIYYEMGIELERYIFVKTHLQMGLFYYILFSEVKKSLKEMFGSLQTRRCVSEIHSTMWSRCRLSAINGVIVIYGRAQQPLMLSLPI